MDVDRRWFYLHVVSFIRRREGEPIKGDFSLYQSNEYQLQLGHCLINDHLLFVYVLTSVGEEQTSLVLVIINRDRVLCSMCAYMTATFLFFFFSSNFEDSVDVVVVFCFLFFFLMRKREKKNPLF